MIKPEQWQRNSPSYYSLYNKHGRCIADMSNGNGGWVISTHIDGDNIGWSKEPPFEKAEAYLAEQFDDLITWCNAYRALVFPDQT